MRWKLYGAIQTTTLISASDILEIVSITEALKHTVVYVIFLKLPVAYTNDKIYPLQIMIALGISPSGPQIWQVSHGLMEFSYFVLQQFKKSVTSNY